MADVDYKGETFILQKVKNHPELKDLTEEQQMIKAIQLTSHEDIRCQFSYLLETGSKLILEAARDDQEDDEFLHTMELRMAHQRAKQDTVQACHLPVKLILSQLRRGRPPLANTWSSLFKFKYGPLHSALQVGEVLIEWGRESLVIPKYEPILPSRQLQFYVHGQGEWRETVGQFVQEMSLADRRRTTEEKVDVLYRSVTEKTRLIENLIDVIVKYNREKKYDLFKCNCQHFVGEAMAALGIKETPQFSGKLSEYYELLKQGKTKMPEFQDHESVDRYVVENFDQLTQHDMEFLLCQYFQHHSADMAQADDIDVWKCTLATCQSDKLEDRIKQNSLLFNQFHPDAPPQPIRATGRKRETAGNVKKNENVAELRIEDRLLRAQPQPIIVGKPPNMPTLLEDKEQEQDKAVDTYTEQELPQEVRTTGRWGGGSTAVVLCPPIVTFHTLRGV